MLKHEYNSYFAQVYDENGDIINNYDLSWLGQDKNEYINYLKEALEPLMGVNLRALHAVYICIPASVDSIATEVFENAKV